MPSKQISECCLLKCILMDHLLQANSAGYGLPFIGCGVRFPVCIHLNTEYFIQLYPCLLAFWQKFAVLPTIDLLESLPVSGFSSVLFCQTNEMKFDYVMVRHFVFSGIFILHGILCIFDFVIQCFYSKFLIIFNQTNSAIPFFFFYIL